VKPARFEYYDPATLDDALGFLAANSDSTKVLAGGQSLMPTLNMRLVRPDYVLDIGRVEGLAGISERDGAVVIGAMTRQAELTESPLVAAQLPLVRRALEFVGHAATRYRGTIGGSLVHADPSAELPAAMVALDASVVLKGSKRTRMVAAREFFLSYFTTSMEPDELLVEVRVPTTASTWGIGMHEFARRHGDFGLAGAMAAVELDGSGRVARSSIVALGVDETPVRLQGVESMLQGQEPAEDLLRETQGLASESVEPESDMHASADFRRRMTGVLTGRALADAVADARDRSRA
jgi:CO/xanthine dehydrogenase FAD-binding subunit